MSFECNECERVSAEASFRFYDRGRTIMFCEDCWEAFPPLPGPRGILNYPLDLQSLPGVGLRLARRICQHFWKSEDRAYVFNPEGDPYRLTDLPGFGFKKADIIALKLGVPPDSPKRAAAATCYVLEQAAQKEGHTWLPLTAVNAAVREFALEAQVHQDKIIIIEDDDPLVETRVALRGLYAAEDYVAQKLTSILEPAEWTHDIYIGPLQEDQAKALKIILHNRVSVLLGPAGTGKTTLLKTLLQNLTAAGTWHPALAAPTGKAARRMRETTKGDGIDIPAKTIHRLLQAVPRGDGGFMFLRDEDNPLEENFIIIDEASMIDVRLMQSLMRAIPRHARILLVGDPWQLPSVGPGDVLRDLTSGPGCVPYVILTQLKRQDPAHLLAANCARVRAGQMIEVNNKAEDFFFANYDQFERPLKTGSQIINEVVSIVTERIPKRWPHIKPEEIQVLAALRESGEVSCVALNQALRAKLNSQAAGSKELEPGDRVIQTRNDYELSSEGVMNGELGVVVAVRPKKREIIVKFDNLDEAITIPWWQRNLDFAWCLTTHRAQGSEWKIVVIPIHKSNGQLVARQRWFYTALSRGKEATIVIGDRSEVAKVIGRRQDLYRQTFLRGMLEEIKASSDFDRGLPRAEATNLS